MAEEDFALPAPPSSAPRPAPEPVRSNADFRKLLQTPRAEWGAKPGKGGAATPRAGARSEGDDKKRVNAQKPKPRPKPKDGEEGDPSGAGIYRDRAAERRKDVNPDYEGDEQLAASLGAGSLRFAPPGSVPLGAADAVRPRPLLGCDGFPRMPSSLLSASSLRRRSSRPSAFGPSKSRSTWAVTSRTLTS